MATSSRGRSWYIGEDLWGTCCSVPAQGVVATIRNHLAAKTPLCATQGVQRHPACRIVPHEQRHTRRAMAGITEHAGAGCGCNNPQPPRCKDSSLRHTGRAKTPSMPNEQRHTRRAKAGITEHAPASKARWQPKGGLRRRARQCRVLLHA
jgi:hypothetical protein